MHSPVVASAVHREKEERSRLPAAKQLAVSSSTRTKRTHEVGRKGEEERRETRSAGSCGIDDTPHVPMKRTVLESGDHHAMSCATGDPSTASTIQSQRTSATSVATSRIRLYSACRQSEMGALYTCIVLISENGCHIDGHNVARIDFNYKQARGRYRVTG